MDGWIGVDLDGTLAEYEKWMGPTVIGAPIPAMAERVKAWLAEGRDVRIFTARVSHDGSAGRAMEAAAARIAITSWCQAHLGCELPITNAKDYLMLELWDDRCVAVEHNTGRVLGGHARA